MLGRLIELPFCMSDPVSEAEKLRLEAEALSANDRYVLGVLEELGLCPYAKAGRERGKTERYVHFAESRASSRLADVFAEAAPRDVEVLQLIFPLVLVEAANFCRFVNDVTEALNRQHGSGVFASAALHPALNYRTDSAAALISLFRRAPDPTLQWVRLSALDSIYRGRKGGTNFVDLSHVAKLLGAPAKRDLYEEIARSNQETAERVGIQVLEHRLTELHQQTQAAYRRILAGG